MSKLQTLRVMLSERLTAAAEEIFVLFERTIVEYEEELCRSEIENQRKQRLLDVVLKPRVLLPRAGAGVQIASLSPPDLSMNRENTQTVQMKEEPEEQSVNQQEEQLLRFVPESIAVCVKTEESSVHQQIQTEHREETQEEDISTEPHFHSETEGDIKHSSDPDNDDDRKPPISPADAQMETEADEDHDNQVQTRDRSRAAPNSGQSPENKSVPETSAAINNKDTSGTDEGSEGKKYQCSVCKKRFLSDYKLQTHIRVHTGERPYGCLMCEKTFTQKGTLKTHIRTHTGEKPYSCSLCDKKFTQSSALKTHMRTHTGEKPYRCSICTKTFSEKGNLKIHMRIHINPRPVNSVKKVHGLLSSH